MGERQIEGRQKLPPDTAEGRELSVSTFAESREAESAFLTLSIFHRGGFR